MFGSRRSGWDTKRGACRIVRRTPREEKAVSVHTTNRLLLAYYEKGYKRICEKVPQLPNVSQFDPYPPIRFT